ncbi:hypothetical protein CLV41_111154 [Roseibium marinum]|uniref:Uncharacterized protein n=1 Tax=Roseibium marinum TaxID=281252 RepID=A0A2S3UMW8_9HYPH|nr:hypothetical protein CLV41_111154 [Roseibium marinum]
MLTVLGNTATLAWCLPLLAAFLLFAVYFLAKVDVRKPQSGRRG